MAKEIRWTDEADKTFEGIIEYLYEHWSEREIEKFATATNNVLGYISQKPTMFRKTSIKDVHEVLVTPHNLLVYKIYPTYIDLLIFWDTRQNPKKKKY